METSSKHERVFIRPWIMDRLANKIRGLTRVAMKVHLLHTFLSNLKIEIVMQRV